MPLWFVAAAALVHLQHDGVLVTPGHDNASARTSSIIKEPVQVPAWDVSDEVWNQTVACLRRVYAPFDVEFTTDDPGDVPHMSGVFGGTPEMYGFPKTTAGMSPFRADCSVIDEAMVFVFTDKLPKNPVTACRIMAQELGHSFGLDHALADGDPMSVKDRDEEPMFVDEDVACGETTPRPCGLPGRASCRPTQNSYAILAERLGSPGENSFVVEDEEPTAMGGCAAGGSASWLAALGLLALRSRRRGADRSRPDRQV